MKFLHEFVDYPNRKNMDNGWWQYDPDTGKVYNRNGGWHDYKYHPKEEIIESTWADILKLEIRDDSYTTGWIAPDGTFYGCAPMDHIGLAKYYLGKDEAELEEAGWMKITEVPYMFRGQPGWGNDRFEYYFFNPYKYITDAQIKTLNAKGIELKEYDKKYNTKEGAWLSD